jgi:hypothetical protein
LQRSNGNRLSTSASTAPAHNGKKLLNLAASLPRPC